MEVFSGPMIAGHRNASAEAQRRRKLVQDFEAKLFDDRIGEHILGNAFDLGLGFLAAEPIELEDEEFPLAHVLDFWRSRARKARAEWSDPEDRERWTSA